MPQVMPGRGRVTKQAQAQMVNTTERYQAALPRSFLAQSRARCVSPAFFVVVILKSTCNKVLERVTFFVAPSEVVW